LCAVRVGPLTWHAAPRSLMGACKRLADLQRVGGRRSARMRWCCGGHRRDVDGVGAGGAGARFCLRRSGRSGGAHRWAAAAAAAGRVAGESGRGGQRRPAGRGAVGRRTLRDVNIVVAWLRVAPATAAAAVGPAGDRRARLPAAPLPRGGRRGALRGGPGRGVGVSHGPAGGGAGGGWRRR
jgi:hypothetical protein